MPRAGLGPATQTLCIAPGSGEGPASPAADVWHRRPSVKEPARTLRFGLRLHYLETAGESAKQAEAMGFDYVFAGEHMLFHRPRMNAFIALAAAAATTQHVRLLSAVTLLPLYPAPLAAKLASCLDVISRGRFELGVGIGGEYPPEFEAAGVPLDQRARRTDEALEIIRRLFSGAQVTYEGRFHQLRSVRLQPPPVQGALLPIWVAGRRDGAIARAARYGDYWMPYLYSPEQVASSLGRIA